MTHLYQPSPSKPRQPFWFTGFLVLLALVPLPFGSNRAWASDLFGLFAGILLTLCARDLYRDDALWPRGAPWRRMLFSAACLFVVLAWGFLQTTSLLPAPHPLWTHAAQTLGTSLAGSVSLTPDRFGECALRILSYAACFLLAFFGGRDAARARLLLRTLAFVAVAYAFYGLLMQSSGLHIILWFRKWAYYDQLTSTFVNKNSYATYAGFGLICCLGLLWRHIKKQPPLNLLTFAPNGARFMYLSAMCLIVFGALILTSSRAGIASSFAGCLVFLAALAINRKWANKKRVALLLPAAAFLIALASFGSDRFLSYLDPAMLQDDSLLRIGVYETILRALDDNPWQGFGLGAFDSAFHLYRNADVRDWFEHAHNDYLELAVELGIPATCMFLAAIVTMIACCAGGVVRRRKHEIYSIVAVASSAIVSLHSLVDFSMEIPAVAATYAAILGLGVAQSWSSREIREERASYNHAAPSSSQDARA